MTVALHLAAPKARGQWQANTGPAGAGLGAVVGGDVERYVRALAIAGMIAPIPWAVRPFGPDDLREVLNDSGATDHPWREATRAATRARAAAGGMLFVGANSATPNGANDGPMWQGRGVNAAAGGALRLRLGGITAVAAPIAFVAQNAAFTLMAPPPFSRSPYANPLFPLFIDQPQRMGGSAYSRLDPGESSIRVDASGLVASLSTASVGWGLGETFPAILGPNAGGFPHLSLGTRARGIGIPRFGRVTGRYLLGVLNQSAWSPVQGSETFIDGRQTGTRRVGSGLALSFTPAALPTLELGASRFFHSPFLSGPRRWDAWSKPFEGIFKNGFEGRGAADIDPFGDADNQLASFFARWVFPRRGVEASIELIREDHNWDSRDLAQEPESNGAISASIRATTRRTARQLALLTFEFFDGDVRPIAQGREQGFLYIHAGLPQGHTQRGQLLGSPIGAGAIAGQRVSWESFTQGKTHRFILQRWRTRSASIADFRGAFVPSPNSLPNSHDWVIDGSASRTSNRGKQALTLEGGLAWWGRWNLAGAQANVYARASYSAF